MSCKFKNLLGTPNKGVHKWHIGPFAVADTLLTIALAIVVALLLKINVLITFPLVFIIGELFHIVFGVQTSFLTWMKIDVGC
jgi:hypothetical protein